MESQPSSNIAACLRTQAQLRPQITALLVPSHMEKSAQYGAYARYTFAELEEISNEQAWGFHHWGLVPGNRVLVFLQPGIALTTTLFALFQLGAIPVLIDPGMGLRSLLHCIHTTQAHALIGETKVHILRRLFPRTFQGITRYASRTPGWNTRGLASLRKATPQSFPLAEREEAAILFTSGSTGPAKGVVYTHRILSYQVEALQTLFGLQPGKDVHLAGFPFFALFSVAMGVTSVVADLNASYPGRADPAKLVTAMATHKVTFATGSPAIWERVSAFCQTHHQVLPSLRVLALFGAPVRQALHVTFAPLLPHGTTYTPYGATECLPVSWSTGAQLQDPTLWTQSLSGKGTCIGAVVPGTHVRIVAPQTEAMLSLPPALPVDEVGEILVEGPQVTPRYWELEQATTEAKIIEGGKIWHRMGDLGSLDTEGRLWFCGRKAHRVTLPSGAYFDSIPCETPFNQHPQIRRTALLQWTPAGESPRVALAIERWDRRTRLGKEEKSQFRKALQEIAHRLPCTRALDIFFLASHFPVDTRHNIKIDRAALSHWFSQHPRRGRL